MLRKKNLLIFFLICLVGVFLRVYRMNDLAVFLADQAGDSSVVLRMLQGKFTLLGPITSVGGFYNGPIVYYLMLPFYWLFKGDPLSGTIFQTFFSLTTLPLMFLVGKKIKNDRVGLLAAFMFAVSPLLIDYSRAAFNSYPAVFFSTLIIYIFLTLDKKITPLTCLILGLFIGFILQMHYLAIAFFLLALFYPFLLNKKARAVSYYLFLFVGIGLGLSPFLAFEMRHHFLNIHLFFRYMISGKGTRRSILFAITIWPQVTGLLFLGGNFILGVLGFLFTAITVVRIFVKEKKLREPLRLLFLLFIIIELISLFYGRKLETHYVVSFLTSIILLSALSIDYWLKNRYLLAGVVIFLFIINSFAWNIDKPMHPLQRGLSIDDFKKAASIVKSEHRLNYNVAMDAEGDNRAMPLRYMLSILGENPMPYTDYAGSTDLFFLSPRQKPLSEMHMWEYMSFGPSSVLKKWPINGAFVLYELNHVSLK